MEYIAHIEEERKQRLIDHLDGTAKLAGKFAESFGKYEWGYCIGMLHDLGKYSKEFQHKIQFNTNDRVDHSTAGMRLCNEKGGYYSILQYAIAGHHSGLMDYYKLEERYRKSICDYQAYRQEVEIPQIKSDPFESCKTQNPHFSMGIFMRMLYSCLVDADFLETESFMKNNHVERTSGEEMASLEMHHCMLNIYDIAIIITEHILNTYGAITEFDLSDLLRYEHTQNNIPVVMLCKTCHQLYHHKYLYVHPEMVFGKWWSLLERYPNGLNRDIAYKLMMYLNNSLDGKYKFKEEQASKLLELRDKLYDWSTKLER